MAGVKARRARAGTSGGEGRSGPGGMLDLGSGRTPSAYTDGGRRPPDRQTRRTTVSTATHPEATQLDRVVIRFAGDSGDGMQLTGTQFTSVSSLFGNDTAT